jgi:hypothetical protein
VATVAAVSFAVLPPSGSDVTPDVTSVAALLEDAALAAEHEDPYGTIRDDQFVYVDTQVTRVTTKDGSRVVVPLHRRETWVSVDGTRDGLIRDETNPGDMSRPAPKPGEPAYDSSSYNHLKSLPTDPGAMYDYLVKASPKLLYVWLAPGMNGVPDKQQTALLLAGSLLRDSIVPPAQSAALYRAVARIPGVTVIEDSVDARGRHGIGIVREDSRFPIRVQWTFDEKTYELLGMRMTVSRDYKGLKKGTLLSDTAVMRRAVVDKAGERP